MSVILFSTILVSEARHIGSAAFHRRYAPRIEGQESTRGIAERRRTDTPGQPNAKTTVTVVETVLRIVVVS